MAINLRLTRREWVLALLTAGFVVAGQLYVFAIEPVALRWLDVRRAAREAETELARLRQLVANREFIEREYGRLQGAVTSGRSEQELQVSLLTEVDKLATSSGLEVSSMKPTSVRKENDFARYGVELQAHCEGHTLVGFLFAMQEPEHLLHVDRLTLVAGQTRPPLTVTLRISKLARLERR